MTLKFEVGKKYVDRLGRINRVLCIDLKGPQSIITARECGSNEVASYYTPRGHYFTSGPSDRDLIAEYKEPQPPRKLYAYQVGDSSEIRLFQERLVHHPGFPRAPEYDITID
jgi:hypothetical protein